MLLDVAQKIPRLIEKPVRGKTYSLFGDSLSSNDYYEKIERLADATMQQFETSKLIYSLQKAGRTRRLLKSLLRKSDDSSLSKILDALKDSFACYTKETDSHLQGLSPLRLWDRRLGTTEQQYHLSMLEIELVNRFCQESFKKCETRVAFLPHCLHDLERNCMAKPDGIDYVCKGCSKNCWINHAALLLKRHDVDPYIWMGANIKILFRNLKKNGKSLGVLGIACIPELINGMRMCMRFDIPVMGIPLNANRCIRWMGDFHPTSINLEKLEGILKD